MARKYLWIAAALLASALLVGIGMGKSLAQEPPANTFKDPDEAARAWLEIFQQTVTESNYKELGFESLEEAKQAQLGEPMAVRMLKMEQMRDYQEGVQIESLADEVGWMIYPVLVREQVRVALELGRKDELWAGTRFGSGNFVRLLERTRRAADDYVLAFPALNQYFIASGKERELRLYPILDDAELRWKAGEPLEPADALARMSKLAAQADDLPR